MSYSNLLPVVLQYFTNVAAIQSLGVSKQIWRNEIIWGILLMCQNITRRVCRAWIITYYVLFQNHMAPLVICQNPALVRDKPRGAPISVKLDKSHSQYDQIKFLHVVTNHIFHLYNTSPQNHFSSDTVKRQIREIICMDWLIDWYFISKKCTYIYINNTYKQIKSSMYIQKYMYHLVATRETAASLSKLAAFRLTSTWLGHELII